jgi:uncharacterized alpha/beta hydrolase family protein
MAQNKQPSSSLILHSFSLSPENDATLQLFSHVATDHVGRAVSKAAIIRALVRYAAQQGVPLVKQLVPFIDAELNAGVLWGTKRVDEQGNEQ